jgi:DNA-binding SARP family transcriptional activator
MAHHPPPRHRADVALLGRLTVAVDGRDQSGFEGRRVQELLGYLVVNHDCQLARERIADTMWRDDRGEHRKQLRQVIWQLQQALTGAGLRELLLVDADWIGLRSADEVRVDVLSLERAVDRSQGLAGPALPDQQVRDLRSAIALYRGDLLPACYEDWCILERERYRAMYLTLLDKLMAHAESSGLHELGLSYGERLLRQDRASERTHRRMMRMRNLAGDRTGALRQFDRCARALREELDVGPSPATLAMAEAIRRGHALEPTPKPAVDVDVHALRTDGARAALRVLQTTLQDATELIDEALAALGGGTTTRRDDA